MKTAKEFANEGLGMVNQLLLTRSYAEIAVLLCTALMVVMIRTRNPLRALIYGLGKCLTGQYTEWNEEAQGSELVGRAEMIQ